MAGAYVSVMCRQVDHYCFIQGFRELAFQYDSTISFQTAIQFSDFTVFDDGLCEFVVAVAIICLPKTLLMDLLSRPLAWPATNASFAVLASDCVARDSANYALNCQGMVQASCDSA